MVQVLSSGLAFPAAHALPRPQPCLRWGRLRNPRSNANRSRARARARKRNLNVSEANARRAAAGLKAVRAISKSCSIMPAADSHLLRTL